MVCNVCKYENTEDSNFCTKCGNNLVVVCSICHTRALKDNTYCRNCGNRLLLGGEVKTAAAASAQKSIAKPLNQVPTSKNSERKNVTVLFADISGFTAMSEKLDPEEVTSIMNECLGMMGDCVIKYEGYIDKFIGDCIMAIFGAPITHENDPELALLAALDMNKKMEEFNKNLPVKLAKPLTLHIGINTGLVVAGDIGSDAKMDYTVMGDTVNLASRLESKATNGQIFISAYTYNQTKNLFEFKKHDPVEVKGKKDPVDIYEVVRALKDSEIKSSNILDVPIVGRDKELEVLENCTSRLKSGEGQAIFLVSDPGYGKSRVQIELKKGFDNTQIQFMEANCHSFSRNTPYNIFIDLFKQLFGIDSNDLQEAMGEKLISNLPLLLQEDKDFLTDEAKSAMVWIGRLLGVDLSERYEIQLDQMSLEEINTATIKSINWVFTTFSRRIPLVLSLEDLHYCDAASIEIINSLMNVAISNPIMLILLFRPEKNKPVSKLIPYARKTLGDRAIEINFKRLTRQDCESLTKFILESEDIPKEVLSLIGSRSDGNPLFLQEIIHSLQDSDIIQKSGDGKVNILKKLSEVTIPNSITGLIMSRFDQLSSELRELMCMASVIGPTFSRKLIVELMGENGLDDYLEELVNAEMIFESSSFPNIKYSFHTSYIQEAVYSTLLMKRRQQLHKSVAKAIEKLGGENLQEYLEPLAYHYYEANDKKNAYKYFEQSGLKAKEVFANESAAKFLSHAIELAYELKLSKQTLIDLNIAYSEVLELNGDMDGATQAWEKVIKETKDSLIKANAMRNIGRIEEKRGLKESAVKTYEKALELIKDKTDTLEYGMLLMNISWILNRFRKIDEAIEKSTIALKIFEDIDSKENIAFCRNNLSVFYENKGEFDTALEYNQKSLVLFKEINNRRQIGNVELSLGYLYNKMGETKKALEYFSSSEKTMDTIGNSVGMATALLAKGRCYEDMKRYDDAETAILFALSRYKEFGMDRRVVATGITLINVLLDKKDISSAYKYLEEIIEIAKANDFQSDLGKLNRLWARTLRDDGEEDEAKSKYKDAIKLFKKLGREKDVTSIKKELG